MVLEVVVAERIDSRHAKGQQIAVLVCGVTLEVAVQRALHLGEGQFVSGEREMIHADVFVAGCQQVLDALVQDGHFHSRLGQLPFVNLALRFEHLWHMCIVE